MATSSGEPRPKRARVDRSDADAKLDKAEKDYAEAKQELAEREKKLEAALNTQSRDNDLIQFLKEAVQTAKEAVQFAQQMLLQSKSQAQPLTKRV